MKIAQTIENLNNKFEDLEKTVSNLSKQFNDIEGKIESKLLEINTHCRYIAERFKVEPLLCDPHIAPGDLVRIPSDFEGKPNHRIVQKRTSNDISVIDEGEVKTFDLRLCKKVGHSPVFKYLILKNIREEDIEEAENKAKEKEKTSDNQPSKKRKL